MPASFNPATGTDWSLVLSNPIFVLGAALGVASVLILIIAFSYGKASVLFPLSGGTGYVTTLISANLLLGESLTWGKLVAVCVIIAGVSLLSRVAA